MAVAATAQSYDSRIWIPVKINDQPVRFIFDTGATGTILFQHTAARLHLDSTPLPQSADVVPGNIAHLLTEPVKFTLLGKEFTDLKLAIAPDPPGPSNEIDGVIGWPNLSANNFLFTGANLEINLLHLAPDNLSSWPEFAEKSDHQVLSLRFPLDLSGQPAYLGVDTGSPHGLRLEHSALEAWRKAHRNAPTTLNAYYTPGSGLVVSEEIWVPEFDLHGLKLNHIPMGPMNPTEQHLYPPGTLAVIGLQGLRRLDLFHDSKNQIAHINPIFTPAPPYPHNMIGAVFTPENLSADSLLAHVVKGSPAYKAGVREGDVLIKINEMDVTSWRTTPGILPLSRFFYQPPGTVLHLTLKRGDKTFVAKVTLRTILGPG